MAPEDTVAAGRRLDLASLFCLIGRHGPAVLFATAGIATLLVALLIYRSVRGKRWLRRREAAVSPAVEPREPGCERKVQLSRPGEELQSGETTDAQSDETPPELVPAEVEEVDGVESNLKVRPRQRRRKQKVDVARAGKKPPPTRSSPPTTAPVQQVPEVVKKELQEPLKCKKLPQEFEKVLAADHLEDVAMDPSVAELNVQCPADKCALKQDQVATVEDRLEEPSTELSGGPSEGHSEKSSKESVQKTSEGSSEEHEYQLRAGPVVTSDLTERLEKKSVTLQGDIYFSAKEYNKEDSQRLQEKDEEKDKQEKDRKQENEKEVQKDIPSMENLLPSIPTTRVDVQYEDQRPTLNKSPDEPPAEVFGSQRSQLELQSQDCHPPSELLAEELLTSFVVVNTNSQNCSPTSDQMKDPLPASPTPPLDKCHFTSLELETSASCESKDQNSGTGEPSESTADHLVLVSDIPKKMEIELHSPSTKEAMDLDFAQEDDLPPNSIQKERLPPESALKEVELVLNSTDKKELIFASAQEKEELLLDSIQAVGLLPISTQEDNLAPNFIQEERELIHDYAKEEEDLPSNQKEELPSNFITEEVQLLSNSTVQEELLSEAAQKEQLLFDSTQKEVLLPNSNQEEKLPPKSAQEKEEMFCDSTQEERLPPNFTEKEVKFLPTPTQEEKLLSEFVQEENLLFDYTQKVEELPPDSAPKVQLHSNLTQKDELLPDSNQKEKLPSNSGQEEEIFRDSALEKKLPLNSTDNVQLVPNFTQEEEFSSGSSQKEITQDDITPPVTTVSWWSSGGRDPAPGDWILIPEFLANEDTFGQQVESDYQRLMDQFVTQVEESLKAAVEVIDREGQEEEEEEMEKKSGGTQGAVEELLEKKDDEEKKREIEEEQKKKKDKEAGKEDEEKEQESRRTEISIMEATMDANEWISDSGQQILPWLGISTQEHAEESSTLCAGGGPAPRVATIPPLMPQTVEVTFRLHYLTWSEQQTLAITGSRPELGGWAAFIPLEREVEGKEEDRESDGWGLWSGRVRLPAHSQLEWKFVVLDMGRVSRWEECKNRVLNTGDQDQLVHRWWGRE